MIFNTTTSETSDTYLYVVARPKECWRIAVCQSGIQWLLQRVDGERNGVTRWTTCAYAMTKPGLRKALRRFLTLSDVNAEAIINELAPSPSSQLKSNPVK